VPEIANEDESRHCVARLSDVDQCDEPVELEAPLDLCSRHLLLAFDWVARDVGVSDVLPAPCAACGSNLGIRFPSGWLCAVCEWPLGERPDGELPPPRVDVVYYIRYDDRIKIGTSANPRLRIAALPHDEVLAFERGGRPLEQRRHAQFAEHRIPRTEWFESNDALRAHIEEVSAGVDDPWEQYAYWLSRAIALRG
jgi:hypothetical protein